MITITYLGRKTDPFSQGVRRGAVTFFRDASSVATFLWGKKIDHQVVRVRGRIVRLKSPNINAIETQLDEELKARK